LGYKTVKSEIKKTDKSADSAALACVYRQLPGGTGDKPRVKTAGPISRGNWRHPAEIRKRQKQISPGPSNNVESAFVCILLSVAVYLRLLWTETRADVRAA
jgi:hypothetical protein